MLCNDSTDLFHGQMKLHYVQSMPSLQALGNPTLSTLLLSLLQPPLAFFMLCRSLSASLTIDLGLLLPQSGIFFLLTVIWPCSFTSVRSLPKNNLLRKAFRPLSKKRQHHPPRLSTLSSHFSLVTYLCLYSSPLAHQKLSSLRVEGFILCLAHSNPQKTSHE